MNLATRLSGSKLIRTLTALAMALAFAWSLAGSAAAAHPSGGSADQAIPLTGGTITGSVAPGQIVWYSYWHNQDLNDAVTMKTNPAIAMTPTSKGDYWGGAYFNVEWKGLPTDSNFPGGQFEKDIAGYYRVGQSTQAALKSGDLLPTGVQYWQQGKSISSIPLVIGVVNQSTSMVDFALTLDQSNDAVSADDNAMPAPWPPTAAAPTSGVVSAAPSGSQTTGQAPGTRGGGTNPSEAIQVNGTMRGTLGPGQSTWFSFYHDQGVNDAMTMKSNPAFHNTITSNGDYGTGVFFNVEWQGVSSDQNFPGGQFEKDWAGLWRVGQSTQPVLSDGTVLPDGTQYWQQGASSYSIPFLVQVVNQSPTTISYALTVNSTIAAVSTDDNATAAPTP